MTKAVKAILDRMAKGERLKSIPRRVSGYNPDMMPGWWHDLWLGTERLDQGSILVNEVLLCGKLRQIRRGAGVVEYTMRGE